MSIVIMRYHMRLWIEFLLLFGGIPLLVTGMPRSVKFTVLWLFVLYALVLMRRAGLHDIRQEWNWPGLRAGLRPVLKRAALNCAMLMAVLSIWAPERLLSFPLERPAMWAMVMLWYPVLSVLPQELVYRTLFHHRYGSLFGGAHRQILAAAISFGWGHIVFLNPVAVGLCTIGGAIFSGTYLRSRSLALAWLEHTLYGCFIFTIGIGWYFFYGLR